MSIFARKSIEAAIRGSEDHGKGMKRSLGAGNLVALGIGAVIGAGLFVRTAEAAGEAAGPAVVVSFVIAAIGCAFAGFCYAEFAAMIPISGSAYTYTYITMGEVVAWVIGWLLVLEYALGASMVSVAWSEYLNRLLGGAIPYQWCHSPFETSTTGVSGIMNVPSMVILTTLSLVLIKGVKESATVNAIIVFIKVGIVLIVIAVGWQFVNPDNYVPFVIPEGTAGHEAWNRHGWFGVLGGAGIVFYAFIGFDGVSTAAQECRNPRRDMPIGILGSLLICTILYVLFSRVLTGVANWSEFLVAGKEASVVYVIEKYMHGYEWLSTWVNIAILAGFSSVILVLLLGQSRVFYTMSRDGLLPSIFSDLHPTFRTPYKTNLVLLFFACIFGGFIPGSVSGNLTSFGTLFAFAIVCLGIWVLRVKDPNAHRPFKTRLVPLVPLLGAALCFTMMVSLGKQTIIGAMVWLTIGLAIYFGYGRFRSKLAAKSEVK
jgi:APA family basic amino acid/polyamine antiporter